MSLSTLYSFGTCEAVSSGRTPSTCRALQAPAVPSWPDSPPTRHTSTPLLLLRGMRFCKPDMLKVWQQPFMILPGAGVGC